MNIDIKKLLKFLENNEKKGAGFKQLAKILQVKEKNFDEFRTVLNDLAWEGKIVEKSRRFYLGKGKKLNINVKPFKPQKELISAVVTRVNKTFGFVLDTKQDTEYFVAGKFLKGALPKDEVLIKLVRGRGEKPEAEVVKVVNFGDSQFTGKLVFDNSGYAILSDTLVETPIAVSKKDLVNAQVGDKVLCEICYRGERHSQHRAKILKVYGNSNLAHTCAKALLGINNVPLVFPDSVINEAKQMQINPIKDKDLVYRTDLRSEIIFTIDGADSKDLDDAVSLSKYDDCYVLGVHIADVSHYVKTNSEIDNEAFLRGTSIYYANKVIPMLPTELSNGICSLNPNEDKLTLSAILTLDLQGNLIDFDFQKSVITSSVKGVYSEINEILNKTADEATLKKYDKVMNKIWLMKELADIRTNIKKSRGAPEIMTHESKILVDENEKTVDILPRKTGESETIIEEFMLLANEACAMVGKMKEVPFVYRIHEPPSAEKLVNLNKTLKLLGLQTRDLTENVKPKALSEILDKTRDLPIYPIINVQILRSMSKAKYSEAPIGHYGLALENYAHFTSPIRRYPDLFVHRVISDLIAGTSKSEVIRRYAKFAVKSAKQSSQTEMNAMKIERQCEDCYKAEYMSSHLGEEFEGMISSVAQHGVYVELDNTVEGLVRAEDLPNGEYVFDQVMEFKDLLSGKSFKIGDKVRIKCVKADVNSGKIDFIII